MGKGDTILNAVIGAVVTIVLSFTAISPIIGGAVAGYLQEESRRSAIKVGALSGAIAFVPFVFFLVFILIIFGGLLGGGFGIPGGLELLIIFVVIFPLLIAWNVGLGALGGLLGVYLRDEF